VSLHDPRPEARLAEPGPTGTTGKVVAAFDLDGTLTRGGSVWKFLVFVAGRTRVLRAGFIDLPKLALAAMVGGSANDSAKEALFMRLLAGRNALDVAHQAASFGLSHFSRRVRPEVRERLEWHRSQGHKTVVVSASPEIYVRAVAQVLGADGFIATCLAVDRNGDLTGHIQGKNCRGAEKERRLSEWIADSAQGDPPPFVWAYGNSAGDLQMLRRADVGVNVGRLGRFGKLRDFRSLQSVAAADQPGSDAAPTTLPS
jgi:HAD superfamily hydrolase (TIGR01490 family)